MFLYYNFIVLLEYKKRKDDIMKRKLSEDEFLTLQSELQEMGYLKLLEKLTIENTMINGVTLFETTDSPEGSSVVYIEDDIVDENGNPYLFEYRDFADLDFFVIGKRIAALYFDNSYILLPLNGEKYEGIGTNKVEKILDLDKAKLTKIASPLVLSLPRDPVRTVNDSDVEEIKYAVTHFGKFKKRSVGGTIAFSILIILIVGIIYIFAVSAVADLSIGNILFPVFSIAALAIIISGIIFFCKFFKNSYMKKVLKMKYIKKVMVVRIVHQIDLLTSLNTTICYWEWIDGKVVYSFCPIGFANSFFSKEPEYGDIINMLSPDPNTKKGLPGNKVFYNIDNIDNNIKEDK